jgi:hypothetical protein
MSNITTYLVSASLILLVIRQIREHPLDARSLATPVLAVGAAAVMFLHTIPAGGSDLVLEAAAVAAGAAMGAIGGLATRLRLGADGRPLGRAGILAASMWIGGVGARLAFAIAAGNGAGPAIARFSIAHHITGSAAWIAALVMMALADVLTRLAVIYLRGRRLAPSPAAPGRGFHGGRPLHPRRRRPRTPQARPRRRAEADPARRSCRSPVPYGHRRTHMRTACRTPRGWFRGPAEAAQKTSSTSKVGERTASSTLLGRCEGGGEPVEGDGLAAQGAGAEDEGQDDLQFSQDLVEAHPGACAFGSDRSRVQNAWARAARVT